MWQFDCQQYQDALSGFKTALQIAESLDEGSDRTYGIANSRYMLARCYEKFEQFHKAIENYQLSSQFYREVTDIKWMTAASNDLATIYLYDYPIEKTESIEQAIRIYKENLTAYSRKTYPQDCAKTQKALGNAYCKRLRGDKAENLETAILHCEAALEVYTREEYPQDWAGMHNDLGIAYKNRIRGDKAENLETAIRYYEAALEVYTREEYPHDWAMVQFNLGGTYRDRIKGEKLENCHRAIACYEAALEVRTREAYPEKWASLQNRLGNIYFDDVPGDKVENLETAIRHYEAALEVYTRDKYPQDWATTQNNLGFAYCNRIQGERGENLERAINCYKAALEVKTHEADPETWASLQNRLGNIYSDNVSADKAENLEIAIRYYESALEVRTRSAYPEDWAMTQNNLGFAYRNRIQGERAENLERAICCYKQALEVYTYSAYPKDWAITQNNLGLAYRNRIKGERAENLEREIYCYKQALEVYTRSAYPEDWAMTQNNLGSAYRNRIKGERAENLERAIWCYGAALEVSTRSAYPKDWAGLNNNLGLAYSDRIQGDQSENLEQALTYYQAALKVYTRDAYLEHWAMIQNNLGSNYLKRIRGDKKENLEWSITCYESALKGYTREAFPQDWAMTQSNLGSAYLNRIQGERGKNLEQSIACLQSALEVRSRTDFIHDYTATLFNMALAYRYQSIYYANNQPKKQIALENAYVTGEEIIDTVEYLRGEISSGDEVKRKLNEQWVELYVLMVKVCIELNRYDKALEYADRSKGRNLSELIVARDLYGSDIPESTRLRLQQIRQDIAKEKERLQQTSQPNSHYLNKLREEFNSLSPYQPMTLKSIKNLLNEEAAIIEWYVSFTSNQFLTFTILPNFTNQPSQADSGISLWQSSPEDFKNLIDWGESYLHDYLDNKTQWQNNLPQRLETLAQILHLDEILQNLRKKFPNCKKLILIPHRFLHLFPLHALPVAAGENQRQTLQELFPKGVNYAPNCQVLKQAKKRINQRPDFNQLFAIQNPTQDLDFTDIEVAAIQSLFNPHQVLKHDQAEKAAILDGDKLKNAHCTHFSCHGYFNFEDALKSALLLAKSEFTPPPPHEDKSRYIPLQNGNLLDLGKCLTIEDILRLDLTHCRLVTLSACETGITDFTSTSDEYIGLPSGFILAGSPNVVCSLWTVNDLSTALLMIRFYQNVKQGETVTLALKQAQIWLRDATVEALQVWSEPILDPFSQEELRCRLSKMDSRSKPFALPYYWAGFCAIGA
jgi:CHAT domain-containing protein